MSDGAALPRVDFFVIGAPRAGTTWLTGCLTSHPAVAMPEREINYWGHREAYGPAWYRSQFSGVAGARVIGENSSLYLSTPRAAAAVAEHYPESKLIVALRKPLDRAISHYRMQMANGMFPPRTSFRRACELAPRETDHVAIGRYAEALSLWHEHFAAAQLHCIVFDDILSRPERVVGEALVFLGVPEPDDFELREADATSASARPASMAYVRWRWAVTGLRKRAGVRWPALRAFGQAVGAKRLADQFNRPSRRAMSSVPTVNTEDQRWYNRLVEADVDRLSQQLDRDLSHWKIP